jgi:hypothetical protein
MGIFFSLFYWKYPLTVRLLSVKAAHSAVWLVLPVSMPPIINWWAVTWISKKSEKSTCQASRILLQQMIIPNIGLCRRKCRATHTSRICEHGRLVSMRKIKFARSLYQHVTTPQLPSMKDQYFKVRERSKPEIWESLGHKYVHRIRIVASKNIYKAPSSQITSIPA